MVLHDLHLTNNRRKEKYNDNLRQEAVDAAVEEYNDTCIHFNDYQLQLTKAFYLLSENIAGYSKFNGIDVDDSIQEGVLICFEKIDRFDPRKGKAFNYMTTMILNSLRQMYRTSRNYNELKKKYQGFLQEKNEKVVIRGRKEPFNFNEQTSNDKY